MPSSILAVGEVLFDHFPDGKRLGGAPCNFAIHARILGADAQILTRLGNDTEGSRIRGLLSTYAFDPTPIQEDPQAPTGSVHIRFDECNEPTYEILPAAWDHIRLDSETESWLTDFSPEMLCFGTLMQRTPQGAAIIDSLAKKVNDSCLLMCDLNLRKGNVVASRVTRSLELCDILKINADELDFLADEYHVSGSIPQRLTTICRRFSIPYAALTLGKSGSKLLVGERLFSTPGISLDGPVNPVGAGDAFAAALAVGILRGEQPENILDAAGRLATEVCRIPGAVPQETAESGNFTSAPGKEK